MVQAFIVTSTANSRSLDDVSSLVSDVFESGASSYGIQRPDVELVDGVPKEVAA